MLTPTQLIELVTKTDSKTSVLLQAGIAVLAGAALVTTFQINMMEMIKLGLVILAFGILAICCASAISSPGVQRLVGAIMVLFFVGSISLLAFSAITGGRGVVPPVYCLLEFWKPCLEVERRVVEANTAHLTKAADNSAVEAAARPAGVVPADHRVFIQFAGTLTRQSIATLTTSLRSVGWNVQGADGERTSLAAGYNEVRYGRDADREAAQALADAVSAAQLTSPRLRTLKISAIQNGKLEIWISN